MYVLHRSVLTWTFLAAAAFAQRAVVETAPLNTMPGQVDSNSPAFRMDDRLYLFNSTGDGPLLSSGADQFQLGRAKPSPITRLRPWPTWIEAVWVDPSGLILAWYHQEHEYICGAQRPAQPWIGALISYDRGRSFVDLGVILSSPDPVDCSSKNGYFAGGHGDFSVILDRERRYFYFLFGNYAGPPEGQGVSIARMAYDDRFIPVGAVYKYHIGSWSERGVGGRTTAIFPAKVTWQQENTNSFWGPAIHWNTHLRTYVILMNKSCCTPGWPQRGIFLSFNSDLSNPQGWSTPKKILGDVGWYPQVLGLGPNDTDTLIGRKARLYVYGKSEWILTFRKGREPAPVTPAIP